MRILIPALALSLAAGSALAQAPAAPAAPAPMATPVAPTSAPTPTAAPRTAFERRFDAANTTHDGHLTKAQAQAAHMTTTVRHFAAIDKDHKGFITLDDLHAYATTQRAQKNTASKPPG